MKGSNSTSLPRLGLPRPNSNREILENLREKVVCRRKSVSEENDAQLQTHNTMDVFLMIRRQKITIFTDAKESTTLYEVKKIVEGILKVPPESQKLYKDEIAMTDENKTLGDYGYTSATARAQAPATMGLVFKKDDGEWEQLDITPLSSPPELPDVMKPQDSTTTHTAEQAAS